MRYSVFAVWLGASLIIRPVTSTHSNEEEDVGKNSWEGKNSTQRNRHLSSITSTLTDNELLNSEQMEAARNSLKKKWKTQKNSSTTAPKQARNSVHSG